MILQILFFFNLRRYLHFLLTLFVFYYIHFNYLQIVLNFFIILFLLRSFNILTLYISLYNHFIEPQKTLKLLTLYILSIISEFLKRFRMLFYKQTIQVILYWFNLLYIKLYLIFIYYKYYLIVKWYKKLNYYYQIFLISHIKNI